jgi:hypothetical protein
MPQPVTYNTGSNITGSIQFQDISYVVDGNNKNYRTLANKTWHSEVPATNQVVFSTPAANIGKGPANSILYWTSATTASADIISIANQLPGSPRNFVDTASIYAWASNNGWFVRTPDSPFESMATDNLVFYLDPHKPSSYSSGSTVYTLEEDVYVNTINSASLGQARYNNPGFSGGIYNTGQTYLGSVIWRTDFIPQNASYIPRLGSTEGFGFYHNMGIALSASTYYLASIYVSSSYPLQSSSTEGYNNTYSNIGGWGFNNTSVTRVNVGGGWTRLYTINYQNTNGYASRGTAVANNHIVNTTSTTTLIVSRSIAQNNLTDFNFVWGVVSHTPNITSNGGLTGLTILNHGLETGSWTKASYPNNVIPSGSGFPYLYYIQLSVPSTSGNNVTIQLRYNPNAYYTAVTDNKYWKVTFNTSSLAVGQTASVFWAAPMIEQIYSYTPSPFALTSGSTLSNGTLTNGTTWNKGGWFELDGVDDYIEIPTNTNLRNPLTVCALINTSVVTGSNQVFYGPLANGSDNWISVSNNNLQLYATERSDINNFFIVGSTFISSSRWYHVVGTINYRTSSLWLNGNIERTSSVQAFTIGSWDSTTRIGQRATGQFPFNGKIAQVQTYNKQLTQAEILQNYYGGPIVTSGLVFAVDAGNLVSYESGSTTMYSLTGSLSGSLLNGTNYNNTKGGSWVFDGIDDYILGNSNLGISGNAAFTIMYFARWDGATFSSNYPSGVGNNSTGITNTGLSTTWQNGRIALDFWVNRFRANTALSVQTWYHVAFTKSPGLIGSTSKLYVNGQEVPGLVEGTDTTPNITNSPFVIGRLDATRWFNGKISAVQIYNRNLTSTEIQQNFNAQRQRFGI